MAVESGNGLSSCIAGGSALLTIKAFVWTEYRSKASRVHSGGTRRVAAEHSLRIKSIYLT